MLFIRSGANVAGSGRRLVENAAGAFVRYFSKKRSPDLRRINPKVPREEAKEISKGLYQIIKDHGPISVGNTWNHAQETGISGLNSKTHMKILLKWMTGRKMLKLSCTHVGNAKRFHYLSLPEEPKPQLQATQESEPISTESVPSTPSRKIMKQIRKQALKEKTKLMKSRMESKQSC